MKKNILKVAFVAAFAMMAGYGVYTTQVETNLSDLALDNVEALAGQEWDGDNTCHMDELFWECLKYSSGVGCYCGL